MTTTPNHQWHKILCPIDFSERSRKALATAVSLAQRDEAALALVHVMHPLPSPAMPATPPAMPSVATTRDVERLHEEMRQGHVEQLARLAAEVLPEGTARQELVLVGRPADELAAFAEADAVDLIVMASRGHGRWRRFLFGSVAERLLKLSHCAVLILPIE